VRHAGSPEQSIAVDKAFPVDAAGGMITVVFAPGANGAQTPMVNAIAIHPEEVATRSDHSVRRAAAMGIACVAPS
jgi:hypothetical protein